MKIIKCLDITQLKLVLFGDLQKPSRFKFADFRGILFQSVLLIFQNPQQNKDEDTEIILLHMNKISLSVQNFLSIITWLYAF